MATSNRDTQEAGRRARFDAFFDFYFPRVYTWLMLRTNDRERAERLSRVILVRALHRFDRGEVVDHAAWILDVAERVLAESRRASAARTLPVRRLHPGRSRIRR